METNKLTDELKSSINAYQINAITEEGLEKELYTLFSDVCVKFAEWMQDNVYDYLAAENNDVGIIKGQWYDVNNGIIINSTQELFDYFITNIYKT
jgi:hypothetical protein